MSNDDASKAAKLSDAPLARTNHRGFLAAGAVLTFLLVAAVYWPALRGEFVWDDLFLIKKNPLVKGDATFRSIWFSQDFPLTTILFWIEWLLWGPNPLGYHIVNLLLHAINAWLVWRVLARLKVQGAALAAILWLFHPVCVASVAWVSETKNTLSLLFFLLSLLCYLRFESQASGTATEASLHASRITHHAWYWFSLVAFLLALLSKTSTVMLPVVMLGCAWWKRGRLRIQDWLRTIPFFILALAFGLMTIWFQTHQAMANATVQSENFWGRLAGAGMALWFYLGKALLPLNLNLIYPRWTIEARAFISYLPLLLWCLALGACWAFRRGWGKPALFALGCFTVTLFPVLGFFDMYFLAISRVSDHFNYLPLIFIMALLAAILCKLIGFKILCVAGPVLVLAFAAMTAQRARVFATDEGLWLDTLAKNPEAWIAHNNLACIRAEQQRMPEAIQHFEESLKFNPRNAKAHGNLGRALAMRGNYAVAESHFLEALRIKSDDADTHRFYGTALAEQRKYEPALKHLREAVRLEPDIETRMQLTAVLRATGGTREAIEQCRLILAAKPAMPEALNNLAWLLATAPDAALRDGKEAVRLAEEVCRLTDYKDPRMLGTLSAAYAEAGQFDKAISTAQKALDLSNAARNPQFASVISYLLNLFREGKAYHEPAKTNQF
jgi:Flp pilus assembly protein TadD